MGAYLSEPITTKATETGQGNGFKWGSTCMQGWRTGMEDAHLTLGDLGGPFAEQAFFAVFDGHGGKAVANFCEKHLPAEIRRLGQECNVDDALVRGFHRMDDMLRDEQYRTELAALKGKPEANESRKSSIQSEGAERGVGTLKKAIKADMMDFKLKGTINKKEAAHMMMKMALLKRVNLNLGKDPAIPSSAPPPVTADSTGCTAVCVLKTEEEFICANAGDSRAVLCRRGKAINLSHDHKPNQRSEQRRIESAGGTVQEIMSGPRVVYRVNGSLSLSRAIGDHNFKTRNDLPPEQQVICATPDVRHFRIMPDDEFVVLACDGIWDVKSSQQVCDFIRSRLKAGKPIDETIEELLDACCTSDPKATQGLGADNMTCLIMQLDQWRHDQISSKACTLS